VIIGVTCAVVIVMAIAGVLVGVKFYMDNASQLVMVFSLQQQYVCSFLYDDLNMQSLKLRILF